MQTSYEDSLGIIPPVLHTCRLSSGAIRMRDAAWQAATQARTYVTN